MTHRWVLCQRALKELCLVSGSGLNDGQWHSVELNSGPEHLSITLDKDEGATAHTSVPLPLTANTRLFFGGEWTRRRSNSLHALCLNGTGVLYLWKTKKRETANVCVFILPGDNSCIVPAHNDLQIFIVLLWAAYPPRLFSINLPLSCLFALQLILPLPFCLFCFQLFPHAFFSYQRNFFFFSPVTNHQSGTYCCRCHEEKWKWNKLK